MLNKLHRSALACWNAKKIVLTAESKKNYVITICQAGEGMYLQEVILSQFGLEKLQKSSIC